MRTTMVLARPRVNNRPHKSKVISEERKKNQSNKTQVRTNQKEVELNTNEPPGALENVSDSVGFRFDPDWLRGWFEFNFLEDNRTVK